MRRDSFLSLRSMPFGFPRDREVQVGHAPPFTQRCRCSSSSSSLEARDYGAGAGPANTRNGGPAEQLGREPRE